MRNALLHGLYWVFFGWSAWVFVREVERLRRKWYVRKLWLRQKGGEPHVNTTGSSHDL